MMLYYYVDDDLGKARSVDGNFDWLVINHLCELVDNNKYQVIAVPFLICQNRQTRDKIHR